jgi:hypothetical protein
MNQLWDTSIAFRPETWAAIARCVFPGGFHIAFGGTRTYHRMVMAMEDSGLICHPDIVWLQSQGFPKATRIDNQIDRDAGKEQPVIGVVDPRSIYDGKERTSSAVNKNWRDAEGREDYRDNSKKKITEPVTDLAKAWAGHRYGMQALKPTAEHIAVVQKPYEGRPIDNITQTGAGALNIDATRIDYEAGGDLASNPSLRESVAGGNGGRIFPTEADRRFTIPNPGGRWPPNVVLSHTPECRKVGQQTVKGYAINKFTDGAKPFGGGAGHPYESQQMPDETVDVWECAENCPVRLLNEQSGRLTSGTSGVRKEATSGYQGQVYGKESRPEGSPVVEYGDTGGAARFFPNFDWNAEAEEAIALADHFRYVAKADKDERDAGLDETFSDEPSNYRPNDDGEQGLQSRLHRATKRGRNNHPSVKPIALTTWLARLLLPPARYAPRRILVPFSGSGSEMIGCILAGWEEVVGIEMTAEYIPIAEARLAYWSVRQLELPMIVNTRSGPVKGATGPVDVQLSMYTNH